VKRESKVYSALRARPSRGERVTRGGEGIGRVLSGAASHAPFKQNEKKGGEGVVRGNESPGWG